jgi:hypothetical protein
MRKDVVAEHRLVVPQWTAINVAADDATHHAT